MEEFFKELSKHYLGISAAVLIAILVGFIIKEPKIDLSRIIVGAAVYFMFIAVSVLMFKFSGKIKEKREKKNVC